MILRCQILWRGLSCHMSLCKLFSWRKFIRPERAREVRNGKRMFKDEWTERCTCLFPCIKFKTDVTQSSDVQKSYRSGWLWRCETNKSPALNTPGLKSRVIRNVETPSALSSISLILWQCCQALRWLKISAVIYLFISVTAGCLSSFIDRIILSLSISFNHTKFRGLQCLYCFTVRWHEALVLFEKHYREISVRFT